MENNNDKMIETFAIDDFTNCHAKEDVLRSYFNQLNTLSVYAEQNYSITSNEFYEIYFDEIQSAQRDNETQRCRHSSLKKYSPTQSNAIEMLCKPFRRYVVYIGVVFVIIALVNYRTDISRLFMRNIQTFIYPGMRYWRKMTLPIIRQFPQLTNLYDESCLLSNPYFHVAELDCAPCINVISVVDLSGYLGHFDSSIPHIVKQAGGCNEREMSVSRIFQLYQSNKQIFQQDAYKVHSTDSQITNLDGLFHVLLNRSEKAAPSNFPIHTTMWRINRMAPARALRTLFRQPNTIPPNAGIDIERYITFDVSGGSTYHLPTTDCSNMFVHQAIGSRVIHLQPTNECAHQCRLLTVKLEQNYTLFYDWWYWKPISTPNEQHSTEISVSYIGSYC